MKLHRTFHIFGMEITIAPDIRKEHYVKEGSHTHKLLQFFQASGKGAAVTQREIKEWMGIDFYHYSSNLQWLKHYGFIKIPRKRWYLYTGKTYKLLENTEQKNET